MISNQVKWFTVEKQCLLPLCTETIRRNNSIEYDVLTIGYVCAGQDTKMRFSVEPPVAQQQDQQEPTTTVDSGFQQWHDAMRMVARLPGGVPPEFRRKVTFFFLNS